MVQLLDRIAQRGHTHRPVRADAGLELCAYCGHSRRNHEHGAHLCARALCDCDAFLDDLGSVAA